MNYGKNINRRLELGWDAIKKNVLITVGTSSIGESMARLFAKEGATVVIEERNKKIGEIVSSSINKSIKKGVTDNYNSFHFFKFDVTDIEQIKELRNYIVNTFHKFDILINNTDLFKTTLIETLGDDGDSWHEVFSTNTDSVMLRTSNFIDFFGLVKEV